ncbi:DUF503 domain-containing protein [Thermoanaerobacterium sp. RBIITD]|uniref:DUF503 domain-containing protein n=1 Tax=Thermoanaerobacterium sp. RBIITD TaxID=1550240 RepID=UPI000BB93412|nr:DUF503 domain-containing protein [Thermoanaerobacterium sp. RBIITD]SNX53647.1 hypothetical protein SAMN05660242_1206 [Thermoanaerobacterium sp. RBIITD]
MVITYCKIHLYANWVHSLKEKRMVVRSIIDKMKHRFNAAIAEVENQDVHQSIVIGLTCCGSDSKITEAMIQKIIEFVEGNTDAYIEKIDTETINV